MPLGSLVLTAAITLGAAPPAGATSPGANAERISRLVEQLGSRKFSEREAATRELDRIGPPALDALSKATHSPDREVQRRANQLVSRIRERALTGQLLAPTRVHLKYDRTPLADALKDFARQSGYPMTLGGDRKALAGRRVTLDTGRATFWQAFDQFCAAAGLVEAAWPPMPSPSAPHAPLRPRRGALAPRPGPVQVAALQPVQADAPAPLPVQPPRAQDTTLTATPVAGDAFVLEAGTPPHLPTCYVGAVRVRVLPPKTHVLAPPTESDEILLPLEIRAEPKVGWQSLLSVQVRKAVDDNGQELSPVPDSGVTSSSGGMDVRGRGGPGPVVAARRLHFSGSESSVRLKAGARPSRRLKELHCLIRAQVRTSPAVLATVDNVHKAGKKPIRGDNGVSLTVLETGREPDSTFVLRLRLERPQDVIPELPAPIRDAGRTPNVERRAPPPRWRSFLGLELHDKEGTLIPATGVGPLGYKPRGGTVVQDVTLRYPLKQAGDGPSRLTFSGGRTVGVEVPFTLKGLALVRD